MAHDDPEEFVGSDRTVKAEPAPSRAARAAPPPPVATVAPAPVKRTAPPASPGKIAAEVECVPFDQFGKIIAPAPEIVAKLVPEKKARLLAMIAASLEADEAEAAQTKNQKDLYAAVAEAQRLGAAYQKLMPVPDRVSELRKVIAARAGNPLPPPEPHPDAEAAALAADEAERLVSLLRADLETGKLVLKNRRATLSEKIMAWQGVQPKRDTAWLVRQNAEAETKRRLARIAQGLPADEPAPARIHTEHISAVLEGGRGDVNRPWKRPTPSWRGGPAPKVPSER
jgi:hypothetical protein